MQSTLSELSEFLDIDRSTLNGFMLTLEKLGIAKRAGSRSSGKGKPSIIWEVPLVFEVKLDKKEPTTSPPITDDDTFSLV